MNTNDDRIMGIDYGEKRIGIALSDPLKIFAYPHKSLLNEKKFWNEFKLLLKEKNVSKIILGIPSGENSSTDAIKNKIVKFKADIENKFKIEVLLRDEDYSSSIAKAKILESVNKKSKRRDKSLVDTNAAAVILQEFLDSR